MTEFMGGGPHRRLTGNRRSALSKILDVIPDGTGPRLTSFRGGAAHTIRPPGSHTFSSDNYFAAVMLAPSPGISAAFGSDKLQTYDAPLGMLVISPANAESQMTWTATRENIVVGIDRKNMLDLAEREFDMGTVDLQPLPFGTIDPKALQIAEVFRNELARGKLANELMIDSLITIFGIHILRRYTGSRKHLVRARGGLSDVNARRVRDFLSENFTRKVSVADLAVICDLSPGHFLQSFIKTFGEPPHKYLVNLRLNLAEKLLSESTLAISEIAYLSGFSSQSHLTSAMRRYRRITPAQIRAQNW